MSKINVEGESRDYVPVSDVPDIKQEKRLRTQTDHVDEIKVVKVEMFNVDKYSDIMNHKGVSHVTKTSLKRYFKSKYNGNHVEVQYKHGKGCEREGIGRLYAVNGVGLQSLERDVRNLLAQDYYWDVDMKNAQPSILLRICNEKGWKCKILNHYIKNREEVLQSISEYYGCSKGDAKNVIIRMMYLGDDANWFAETVCSKNPSTPHEFITKFKNEIANIAENIYSSEARLREFVSKKRKWTPLKKKSSVLSYHLQTEENAILQEIDTYLLSCGRSMDVLIFDGGLVRKHPNEKELPLDILKGCEEHIMNTLGYKVELCVKPMISNLVFDAKLNTKVLVDAHTVIDDAYAAEEYVRLMDGNIVYSEEKVNVFDIKTGQWTNKICVVKESINRHKDQLKFYQCNEDDATKYKLFNYAGNEKNVNNMLKFVPCFCKDETFFQRNAESSLGKLLFADGIYDFDKDEFIPSFIKDIVFRDRISRPFPKEKNEELIKQVHKILFRDPFKEEDYGVADYLKKGLARGLYGDYHAKLIYFCVGEANAGKSLMTDAMSGAFEEFVDVFNGNEMLYNDQNGADEARKLSFVHEIKDKRIAFSNELKMTKAIDGNLLKKIASGWDGYKARVLYGKPEKIINRSTEFLFVNDLPCCKPCDQAALNRIRCVEYKMSFIDKDNFEGKLRDDQVLADITLKTKFKNDKRYQDAMVNVLLDAYREYKRDGHIVPPEIKSATSEWVGEQGTLEGHLKKRYEITNNEEDFVDARELINYLIKDCEVQLSDTKIGKELLKVLKKGKDDRKIGGIKKRVWLGIKRICEIEEDPLD